MKDELLSIHHPSFRIHHFLQMADTNDEKRRAAGDAYERELTTDLKDQTPDRPRGMALHTRILIGLLVGVVAGVATYTLFRVPDPKVAGNFIPHPTVERV